ncbi:MAG TPA: TetR/AcrR family transcriptional regulator [Hyphomonas sp.]|nr:TetR/AcrR family transcriptional regulator [Hyphomonas sp.]
MAKKNRSYIAYLEAQLKNDPPKKKGDRTRAKLLLAAAKVMDTVGFHSMRVADITQTAGVSDGIFYVYFKDKKDISLTLLENFLASTHLLTSTDEIAPGNPFEQICSSNLGWIEGVRTNAGLMRSMYQLADEDPEFGQLVYASNRDWSQRVAHSVMRNRTMTEDYRFAVFFATSVLVGMMDELMRRMVIHPEPAMIEFLDKNVANDSELATALAIVWYRALYPGEPLPAKLPSLAKKLSAFDKFQAAPKP